MDSTETGVLDCSEMVGVGGYRPSGCKGAGFGGGGGWVGGEGGIRDGMVGNVRQAPKAGDITWNI